MSQNENTQLWFKAGLAFIGLIGIALSSAYFGARIFFEWHHLNEANLKLFSLWEYYQAYKGQKKYVTRIIFCYLVVFIPMIGFLIFLLVNRNQLSVHGNARFATESEVEEAGLFAKSGIIVGIFKNKIITIVDDLHAAIAAPSRGGKGVAIVIPNLLAWRDSCVCTDFKKENFQITSKVRNVFFKNEIYVFDPFNADGITHKFNALSYVERSNRRKMIDDIQTIAGYVIKTTNENTDPIWTETPRTLFIGIVLYLFETPGKPVTIGQVRRETLVYGDCSEYYKALIKQRKEAGNPLSPECVEGLMSYAGIDADATRAGIISGIRANLSLWQSPLLDAATSGSDFDFRDLRKKRMTIYNCMTVADTERSKIVSELFWGVLINMNTRELPEQNPALKYKVLLVLDEFGVLGNLSALLKAAAFLAGYGLRLLTIFQSPSQLVPTYKSKEAINNFLDNHHAHVVYTPPPKDTEISTQISNVLGFYDLEHKTFSRPNFSWKESGSGSTNTGIQKRALMLPEELRRMPQTDQIVLFRDTNPIKSKKAYYYSYPYFVNLLSKVSPTLSKKGKSFSKKTIFSAVKKKELEVFIPTINYAAYEAEVSLSRRLAEAVLTIAMEQEATVSENENAKDLGRNSDKIPENKEIIREISHEDLQNILELPTEMFSFDPVEIQFSSVDPLDEFALSQLTD